MKSHHRFIAYLVIFFTIRGVYMLLTYDAPIAQKYNDDGAAKIIKSLHEDFAATDKINISSNQYLTEVAIHDDLYDKYIDGMTQGLAENTKEMFVDMMNTERGRILAESQIANIAPIMYMQGPIYRKMLPSLVVKDIFPTKAAKVPHFKLQMYEPFYIDVNGVKSKLKDYFKGQFDNIGSGIDNGMLAIFTGSFPIATLKNINLLTGEDSDGSAVSGLPGAFGTHKTEMIANGLDVKMDSIDRALYVESIQLEIGIGDNGSGTYLNTANPIINVPIGSKVGVRGHDGDIYVDAKFLSTDAYTSATATTKAVTENTLFSDTVSGKISDMEGVLRLTNFNGAQTVLPEDAAQVVGVTFTGHVSPELNNFTSNVDLEITHTEFVIPHGEHVSSSVSIEYAHDVKAMYNFDVALKISDIMSDAINRKTEIEAWHFLINSYINNNMEAQGYKSTFSAIPNGSYDGHPDAWLPLLRRHINQLTILMKNHSDHKKGIFVIFGNDIDTQLIPDVKWDYVAGQKEHEGIDLNFSKGLYRTNGGAFQVVSSSYLPAGELRIVYIPISEDFLTYAYVPYTFNLISDNSYRNPKTPNIPSITMMKRHTFIEGIPYQSVITISDNTADKLGLYST